MAAVTIHSDFGAQENKICQCFYELTEGKSLKFNIQKAKVMASGLITSWQIDGEKVETVIDFIFLGSKITVDGDCNHEIKTFAPWKEKL